MSKLMSNESYRPMSQFTWQYTDTLTLTGIVSDLTLRRLVARHSSKTELPTSVVSKLLPYSAQNVPPHTEYTM